MSSCTLQWYSDRGFELDLVAEDEDVSLRMVAIPLPADGMHELRAGPVDLDRLEILFKAQVEVQGEPGQLQDARVQVVAEGAGDVLELTATVEDVETGDLIRFVARSPVQVPSGVPERGGPRPNPPDEDELDWEDETTLEQMIVNAPESTARHGKEDLDEIEDNRPRRSGGLKALLDALANLGEEETDDDASEPEPSPAPAAFVREDQQITVDEEAMSLLQLLVDRDSLELEEDAELSDLVAGVVRVLEQRGNPEAKAKALSAWLLEQTAVADLFIGDDELAEILEQW